MIQLATRVSLFILLAFGLQTEVTAQQNDADLEKLIRQKDSLFWNAYNTCQLNGLEEFFTSDLEFYHDMGGVTLGVAAMVESIKNNLCNPNKDFRLRRKALEETVKVYPLKKDGAIYGAIISGEHVFYIRQNGKPEQLDGQALFNNLWILQNGSWKMKRILSYNHHPAQPM